MDDGSVRRKENRRRSGRQQRVGGRLLLGNPGQDAPGDAQDAIVFLTRGQGAGEIEWFCRKGGMVMVVGAR